MPLSPSEVTGVARRSFPDRIAVVIAEQDLGRFLARISRTARGARLLELRLDALEA
jgi:hypothetical protein